MSVVSVDDHAPAVNLDSGAFSVSVMVNVPDGQGMQSSGRWRSITVVDWVVNNKKKRVTS